MTFALWNRSAVSQLNVQERGIELPLRTVGDYLKRWGFMPQKAVRRACKQNPEAVRTWLDETYPEIARCTREENVSDSRLPERSSQSPR